MFYQPRGYTLVVKLNLGCPYRCDGYICVDLSPKDPGVVEADVYDYLRAHSENAVEEIYTKNLLEHLGNPLEFLRLCYRELKPSGKITLTTDNAEYLPFYLPFWVNHTGIGAHSRREYASLKEHGGGRHFMVFTKMHLENLLEEAGFRKIEVARVWMGSRLRAIAIK